jgi:small multidrug resistance family-3 protein
MPQQDDDSSTVDETGWTPGMVTATFLLFVLAGFCEIGGGWLIWKAVREDREGSFGTAALRVVIGSLLLVAYGFVVTLQPVPAASFGRVYAAYGGVFIAMSCLWARTFDELQLDAGDAIGASLCLLGAAFIIFWPRGDAGESGAGGAAAGEMTNMM